MANNDQYPGYGDTEVLSIAEHIANFADTVGSPVEIPASYQPEIFQPPVTDSLTEDLAKLHVLVSEQLFIGNLFSKDPELRAFANSLSAANRDSLSFRRDVVAAYEQRKVEAAEAAIAQAKAVNAEREIAVAWAQQEVLRVALEAAAATVAVQLAREEEERERDRRQDLIATVWEPAHAENDLFDAEQAHLKAILEQKRQAEVKRLILVAAEEALQERTMRQAVDNFLDDPELGPFIEERSALRIATGVDETSLKALSLTNPGLALRKIKDMLQALKQDTEVAEKRHETEVVVSDTASETTVTVEKEATPTAVTPLAEQETGHITSLQIMDGINRLMAARRSPQPLTKTDETNQSDNAPVTSVTLTYGNTKKKVPVTTAQGVKHVANV